MHDPACRGVSVYRLHACLDRVHQAFDRDLLVVTAKRFGDRRPAAALYFVGASPVLTSSRNRALDNMPAATLAEVPSPEQVEAQIEKLFEGQPKGFPFHDFEVDDIMLPDGDDMDIPSDDDDAADEEEILAESGFGSVIGAISPRPPSPPPPCSDHALRAFGRATLDCAATLAFSNHSPLVPGPKRQCRCSDLHCYSGCAPVASH